MLLICIIISTEYIHLPEPKFGIHIMRGMLRIAIDWYSQPEDRGCYCMGVLCINLTDSI